MTIQHDRKIWDEFEFNKVFPDMISWREYKGEAGSLHTMLVGEYKGISFSSLFSDYSLFGISKKRAKRRIKRAVELLHMW